MPTRAEPGPLLGRSARWALAGGFALLAVAALGLPWQRSPVLLLVSTAFVLAAAAARPDGTVLLAAAGVALLPVLGNLLAGPWVAPAELLMLLFAAATLPRSCAPDPSPLRRALVVSVAAMAAGAVAATLAAVAPSELPLAARDLASSLFAPGAAHAALPLRAALVHAAGLLGYLLFRRVSAARGAPPPLAALVAGLALVGAYAVLEAGTGLKLWPSSHYEALSAGLRVPATLPDYNATGAAMALGLFPALVLARQAAGWKRLAWAGAAALLLAGLLLSGSRTAWLATLLVGCLTLGGILLARRREGSGGARRLLVGAGLGLALAVAGVTVWPGDVGELLRKRAATLVKPEAAVRAVRSGRLGFWTAGARMVAAHPLVGVGPGRVPARFDEFRSPSFPVRSENLHNYFLQTVAENGVPGGLLVLLPFLPLGLVAGRLLARGAAFSSAPAALAPGLAAFAATGLASHPWLLPELQLLFWGAAALLPSAPASSRFAGRPWRVLTGVVLVAWCLVLLRRPGEERGRWGFGEWREQASGYFWVGPRALVPVALPEEQTVRVRLRGMEEGLGLHPLLVTLRLDGGPARKVSVPGLAWQDVVMERGPLRPGRASAKGGERGLLAVEASRGFCPAAAKGGDRRVLALQLADPPVAAAGGAVR